MIPRKTPGKIQAARRNKILQRIDNGGGAMSNAAISVDNFGGFEEILDFGFDKRIMSTAEDDDVGGLIDVLKELG